jgi:hypothetical protein
VRGEWTKAKIVRDCTGVYLRVEDQDFEICNEQLVGYLEEGRIVEVKFRRISVCKKENVKCMMAHSSEGLVEVQKIRTN